MTKMQIIAKTVLTVLGIHFIIALYSRYLIRYLSPEFPELKTLLFYLVFVISTAFIFYFLVFNNDRLSRKIAGSGEILNQREQRIFIIKILRLGLFFIGLMMLPVALNLISSIPMFLISIYINIITDQKLTGFFEMYFKHQYIIIFRLLQTILAFYLIFGASAFVSWQVKRSLRISHTPQPSNTIELPILDSERTENE